jgi:hypothetical protein
MDNYLRRYVGTYRVKANYDLETNDFPRDYNGNIDDSFGDFYIACNNNIEIRHATGSHLWCYIPSKKRGMNILKQIYLDKICNDVKTIPDNDTIGNELINKNILINVDILDFEVAFTFKNTDMEYIAAIVKPKTSGKNIQPLSKRNLPKSKSVIPDKEMKRYQKEVAKCNLEKLEKAQWVMKFNKKFEETLPKKHKEEMKKLRMDLRNYIYYKGLWETYIDCIKKEVG